MNLVAGAPPWLAALLMAMLLIAAVEDAWRLRISNLVSAGVAVAAFVAVALAGPIIGLWQNLLLFVAMLAIGTMLFARGVMGGGDIKLLAACALWFDLGSGWKMLVAVAIAGGIEAILVTCLRLIPWPDAARDRVAILRRKTEIPYGIAIAGGMAMITWWLRS